MDDRSRAGVRGHTNRAGVVLDTGVGQRGNKDASRAGGVVDDEQVGAGRLVLDEDDDTLFGRRGGCQDFGHSRIGDGGLRVRKTADEGCGEGDIGHRVSRFGSC